MKYPRPLEHIKAETYLTSFLNSCKEVVIEPEGVFSRNYADDIKEVDTDEFDKKLVLKLSRDSIFHVLPEGMFFIENKLRDLGKKGDLEIFKAEAERIRLEKRKILAFFQPFDMTYFNLRFELEKKINSMTTNRTPIIIDKLFNVYDLNRNNPLIRKVIPLIPIASEIRGNKHLMKDILKILFYPAKVDMYLLKRRKASGGKKSVMKMNIYIEKLSASQFRTLKKDADEFAEFFYEWFLPVDMSYEFKVKDKNQRFTLGKAMTLDYNTYL